MLFYVVEITDVLDCATASGDKILEKTVSLTEYYVLGCVCEAECCRCDIFVNIFSNLI